MYLPLQLMARNFSTTIHYNRQKISTIFIPIMQPNGLHYEVNISGFPRFTVAWSMLGRFDVVPNADGEMPDIPYELILVVSDLLEKRR